MYASNEEAKQVVKAAMGKAVTLNGVRIDGCRTSDGTMLEAKGERYAKFIKKDGSGWQPCFKGGEDIVNQMQRQSRAAGGRLVEWHVAEKSAAVFLDRLAAADSFINLKAVHTVPTYKFTVTP